MEARGTLGVRMHFAENNWPQNLRLKPYVGRLLQFAAGAKLHQDLTSICVWIVSSYPHGRQQKDD
jgi:hypothetical protein